ncbi:MAG: tRNA (adenosine(37)-N6)-threonylcarbamoyltransferase complex ATPase subunit type 1 TsaE [Bacteroidales bacterium]|nr:tRNA (adenosine(37)-N6)-threonylcarbamoyltransferase complex ATPase subunit type 1 TsaE [Bacteroidales bacterium]MDD4216623.1 tRNA (adenosine(37)-N6)-threonylcarbamoyltransferase complex ATPase subunit type 1 TsaE [Bacteroidales bacterium]MDY0141000.1 tRNA (adenosine(37)-N6)-threonylcarbamoyltransferase complex ATPase subunit type 1 TsaE [Bacteroidales bacterium]
MTQIIIKDVNDIYEAAKTFIRINKLNFQNNIFAFYGDMGAGKTTFIKAICKELGVKDEVTSPSFAIVNEHKTKSNTIIYHFDLYRIEKLPELLDIGFEEYINSDAIIFIEWPQIAKNLLPETTINVNITVIEEKRCVEFKL